MLQRCWNLRFLCRAVLVLAALALPALVSAQAAYDADRAPVNFTVGGSFSYYDAAYGGNKVMGLGSFADFGPIGFDELAVEGEAHWLTMNGADGFAEYSFLAGPRYRLNLGRQHNIHPYVKFLVGQGDLQFAHHLAYGRYFAMAPGGGIEVPIRQRMRVRLDYEYQIWPSAPGIPGQSSSALKPNGITVGIAYRVF